MASSRKLIRPVSPQVSVDVFGMSDKGLVQTKNEDHFLVVRAARSLETVFTNLPEAEPGETFDDSGFGLVVADGVGDAPGGEIASRNAIYMLLNLALDTSDWQFRWGPKERNTVLWRMKDRFRNVNAALL